MGGPPSAAGPHLGSVASFDPVRGIGTVADDDGAVYPFHATVITDGSRHIEVGVRVGYLLTPGHGGRHEVRALVKAPGPG